MELDAKLLGKRIKGRRTAQKINQKDLAAQAEVSPSAVNQYEKGEKVPSTSTLVKLAEALDVSSDFLLGASNKEEIFLNRNAKEVFNAFMTLNKRDRLQIMSNISFLKEQSRKNPLRKK
jgi:transcriptional regulator with XRE-family HTH domain